MPIRKEAAFYNLGYVGCYLLGYSCQGKQVLGKKEGFPTIHSAGVTSVLFPPQLQPLTPRAPKSLEERGAKCILHASFPPSFKL